MSLSPGRTSLDQEHQSMNPAFRPEIAEFLNTIYTSCGRAVRLERDPLAIVKRYDDPADREIAALLCSTLAFGSVDLIMRACEQALAPLGSHPAATIARMSDKDIQGAWSQFQYRFCFPKDIIALMRGARGALSQHGSLQALFVLGDGPERSLPEALSAFVGALRSYGEGKLNGAEGGPRVKMDAAAARGATTAASYAIRPNLLPDPAEGSACKRLFLFLRWMVRRDEVDPGGWDSVSPARLVVPMDTHMAATCAYRLGFLDSRRAKGPVRLKDALQVTAQFALYAPEDPVKYDFALTRPGIDPRPGDEVFGCH